MDGPIVTQSTPPWAAPPSGSSSSFQPPIRRGAVPFPEELRVKPSHHYEQPKRYRLGTILFTSLLVVLVAAGSFLAWRALAPVDVEAPLPAREFQQEAGQSVGATGQTGVAIEDGSVMTVSDMLANTLFIPELGIYMPLEAGDTFTSSIYSGFDAITVPKNPQHGVWYSAGGALAGGDEGTTLIASHVARTTGWGALRTLHQLEGGELIYTKDIDGALQAWQLTGMRIEDHTAFPQDYWAADGVRQLVITTCGGKVNRGGQFSQNIFAIATPVETPQGVTA